MDVQLTKFQNAVAMGSAVLVAALTILLFYQNPDCFRLSDLLTGVLDGFEGLVEIVVAPIVLILDAAVIAFDFPPPRDDWKEVFIVSFFLQIRSAQVDWGFYGWRRFVGVLSLLATFLLAVLASYAIGVLAKEAPPRAIALSIALLVLLQQALHNLLASVLRRPAGQTFSSDVRFRQLFYTLGYAATAIVAVVATTYLADKIGTFTLGLYAIVLYCAFAVYLFLLELFLQFRNRLRAGDPFPFISTRIVTAFLLIASVSVAVGILLVEGWLQGRVLAAFVC